ncbi:MAG TPA: lactate utilization protein C [Burkholderiales bacterium]|nr:lactate utilization protein C [Burkholderiales bacterium]
MPSSVAANAAAREAVLARVRKGLGKAGDRSAAAAEAQRYVAAHMHGPRPGSEGDVVTHFMMRAADMASTVARVGDRRDVPQAIARYLDGIVATPPAEAPSRFGVCWPEFGDLDWTSARLSIETRPTTGEDRLGITGCYCAIAETGTLVITTGAETPTATALLPETHVAIVESARVVRGMEEVFALLRAEHGVPPRAINMISGPSRTGDIEQTIVLGAHGPYRLHILVVD